MWDKEITHLYHIEIGQMYNVRRAILVYTVGEATAPRTTVRQRGKDGENEDLYAC